MVTWVPPTPLVGVIAVIRGVVTVKLIELDESPPCETWTVPDVELGATIATILVSLQLETKPAAVPSSMLPEPREAPNFVPVTVTNVPPGPEVGVTAAIFGP